MFLLLDANTRITFDSGAQVIRVEKNVIPKLSGWKEIWKEVDSFTEAEWYKSDFSKIATNCDTESAISHFWIDLRQAQSS